MTKDWIRLKKENNIKYVNIACWDNIFFLKKEILTVTKVNKPRVR